MWLTLQNGAVLPAYELIYETYGALGENKSNAILICHALSEHHHAAGIHQMMIQNPVGGMPASDRARPWIPSVSSSSASTISGLSWQHRATHHQPRYRQGLWADFPNVVVRDWVRSQAALADHLGIETFLAVVGGSLGGMRRCSGLLIIPSASAPVWPSHCG